MRFMILLTYSKGHTDLVHNCTCSMQSIPYYACTLITKIQSGSKFQCLFFRYNIIIQCTYVTVILLLNVQH